MNRYIEKYDVFNLNPYIIVVEDQTILNFYSMIEPSKHFFHKTEDCKITLIFNFYFRIFVICGAFTWVTRLWNLEVL